MKQKDQGRLFWAQPTHPSLQDIPTGHMYTLSQVEISAVVCFYSSKGSLVYAKFHFCFQIFFFALNIYSSVDKHIVE